MSWAAVRARWAGVLVTVLLAACVAGCAVPGELLTGDRSACFDDLDCVAGESCVGGSCGRVVSACADCGGAGPMAELVEPGDSGGYETVVGGSSITLHSSGQGGSHLLPTIRVKGFPPAMDGVLGVTLAQRVTLVDSGVVLHEFTQALPFRPAEDGALQYERRFMFLDAQPATLDGEQVRIELELAVFDRPEVQAELVAVVELRLDGR